LAHIICFSYCLLLSTLLLQKLLCLLSKAQLLLQQTLLLRSGSLLGGALTGEDVPEPYGRFGLKCIKEMPRPQPRRGSDLHKALASGQVMIDAAIGRGFGKDSLQLALRNRSSDVCQVVIQQGTIFQHVDWQHRQNLLVAVDYVISVPAGGVASKKLMAYCMNLSCACSNGNSMELTEFYFDDLEVLQDQSKVWDHFQRSFGLR